MAGPNKGLLAAIAGVLVLGGVVGWRVLANGDSPVATSPAADASSAMSTPMTIEDMRKAAEAEPGDARLWQELGLALFNANRFDEASKAYGRATEADPESAVLWSSLGEARVMASDAEPLPAAALTAFNKAITLDQRDPRARYFLAVGKDLSGDHDGAIADWLALLADTPPGAPWETDVVRTIQQVGAINQIAVEERIVEASSGRNILPASALAPTDQPTRGPTREQMAAASKMSPAQQQNMAEGMVARLAERLESEPGDVEGWIMLMRSYRQLGRDGAARDARDKAIAANPEAKQQLREAAAMLGIG